MLGFVNKKRLDNETRSEWPSRSTRWSMRTIADRGMSLAARFAKQPHKGPRVPLEQVQITLGHTSIQTTEQYLILRSRANTLGCPCGHLGAGFAVGAAETILHPFELDELLEIPAKRTVAQTNL